MKTSRAKAKSRRGFTIVELVIVIAVIAILAAVLIPTFSGIIEKANVSKAESQAVNAYKALTYGATTGAIRDGFVFISDNYAFTNVEQTVHQLEPVGTNTVNNDLDGQLFMFMLGDITYGGEKKGDGAYELKDGEYNVYKLDNPSGSGAYYFWVQPKTDSAASFQQSGLEWVEGADTYSAAMIFTQESESAVISKYKIKTGAEGGQNGIMYDGDFYAPLCGVYSEDGNYSVDFSQVESITIEMTDGSNIVSARYGGQEILSSSGQTTATFAVSQLRSLYTTTEDYESILMFEIE